MKKKDEFMNQRTGIIKGLLLLACIASVPLFADNFINQPTDAVIKSTADARGVHNVDTSLTNPDSVEVTESKVCVIDSKVDIIDVTTDETLSKVCVVDSKLDTLAGPCDPTPITAAETPVPTTPITGPVTLDTSGHYCLSADLNVASGQTIVITGTNITLDLNGYTISGANNKGEGIVISGDNVEVFNGTIMDIAGAGISITGNKNNIHDVTVKDSPIGIELIGADNNTIERCRALCNTQAGFSLTNSNYNQFIDDQALATSGDGDVYGFISTGGQGNRFIGSLAEGTETSSYTTNTVAGFALRGLEQCSEICGSTASKTTAVAGYADTYGIFVETFTGAKIFDFQENAGFFSDGGTEYLDAKWLVCNGTKYLAIGGPENGSGVTVRIFEYNAVSGTLTAVPGATFNHGATIRSIDWVECNGKQYLAIGGDVVPAYSPDYPVYPEYPDYPVYPEYPDYYDYPYYYPDVSPVNVRILEFDCAGGTLTERAQFDTGSTVTPGPSVINSLEWLQGTKFLAVSGPAGASESGLQILEFDATYEALSLFTAIDPAVFPTDSYELNWLSCDGVDYLVAVGIVTVGPTTLNAVGVYEFDQSYPSITQVAGDSTFVNPSLTKELRTAKWLLCGDTKYIAIGTGADSYGVSDILLYTFDPVTSYLTSIPGATFNHNATINDVEWLEKDGCKFLGATSDANGNEFFMLEFDPTTETFSTTPVSIDVYALAMQDASLNRFDWLDCGDTILAGFSIEPPVTVLPSALVSALSITQVRATNNIIKNNVVNGTTGGVGGIGIFMNIDNNLMVSNVSCKNDTNYDVAGLIIQPSAVIKSQIDARGVHNVDCNLTDADSVEVIESKVCAIESKIDSSAPCAPTPLETSGTPTPATAITGPITLDASGHYCLAADLDVSSGDAIVITGTNVTLDLNGYTISNTGSATNGIVISGDGAEVFNGTVSGFSNAGISITGNKNNIHDVTAKDNAIGFELSGADNNVIEHSSALCNTSAGFSLTNSNYNQFIDDQALATSGDGDVYGFVSTSGQGNRFINSVAENTTTSSTAINDTVAGFALLGTEQCTEVCGSTASKTTAATGFAESFGVLIQVDQPKTFTLNNPSSGIFVDGEATEFLDAKWLICDGSKYLAVAGEEDSGGITVRILEYNTVAETLTQVPGATFNHGATVRSIDWIECDGRRFLAIGGDASYDSYSYNVRILEFDCVGGTLTEIAAFDTGSTYPTPGPSVINSLEWLQGTKYFAVTGILESTDSGIQILELDVEYEVLTLFTALEPTGTVDGFSNELNWLSCDGVDYLVLAGTATVPPSGPTFNAVAVYEFDRYYPSLTEVVGVLTLDREPRTAKWLLCGDTKYIAIGTAVDYYGVSDVLLFEFTQYPAALTLISGATFNHDATINDVEWLEKFGCKFLGVSSDVNGDEFFMLELDPSYETFTLIPEVTIDTIIPLSSDVPINRFDWLDCGDVIYIGLSGQPPLNSLPSATVSNVRIKNAITGAATNNNIIKNNVVNGTTGGIGGMSGIGYSLNSDDNLMISNLSCDNDTNYSVNGTTIDPTSIIKSQIDARGVQNVDCALTNADSVEVIESKVCVIEDTINQDFGGTFTVLDVIQSKVCLIEDTINQDFGGTFTVLEAIESKVCVVEDTINQDFGGTFTMLTLIDSKIDIPAPCDPTPITASETPIPATPITGPVTLDTSGHYCLAADLDVSSGQAIVITGTNVTLDLNGYTISGGSTADNGILISGACAEVFNGTVTGFTNIGGAILVLGSDAFIHNVTVKDSVVGLGAAGTGLVLESCYAVNNNVGFALNTSTDAAVLSCKANKNGNGFIFLDTERCSIIDCVAYSNLFNGFSIQNVTECSFVRCIANSNNNNGFRFSGYDSTFSEMKDCQAMYNMIHGFDMSSAASSVSFYRNIACHNPPS